MRQITIEIPGESRAFARAGRGGGFTFTPKPQRDFMAVVKHEAMLAMKGTSPWTGPIRLAIGFAYIHPSSWSKKRKAETAWKTSAPDVDNLCKIVKDSLTKIVYVDDAQVFDLSGTKYYSVVAQTRIIVTEV